MSFIQSQFLVDGTNQLPLLQIAHIRVMWGNGFEFLHLICFGLFIVTPLKHLGYVWIGGKRCNEMEYQSSP